MKRLFRIEGETVCLVLFALAVFASCIAAAVETQSKGETPRFESCPLCGR